MSDTPEVADELVFKPSPVAEYSTTEAALNDLRARFGKSEFDVSSAEGLKAAKKARTELVGLRTALESRREEIKAPILERGRLIDAEAKRITAELLKLETPIAEAIKAEEKRKEQEKAAKELAEKARVKAAQERITAIQEFHPLALGCRTAERVLILIDKLKAVSLDGLDEFTLQAKTEHESTLKKLEAIHAQKVTEQAEREKREAEAREAKERADRAEAELAALRAAQAAKDVELQAEREALAERKRELDEALRKAKEPTVTEPVAPAAPVETPAPAHLENDSDGVVDQESINADPLPFVRNQAPYSDIVSDGGLDPRERHLWTPINQKPITSGPLPILGTPAPEIDLFTGVTVEPVYTPTALEIVGCVADIHCVSVEVAAAWIVAAMDEIKQISTT